MNLVISRLQGSLPEGRSVGRSVGRETKRLSLYVVFLYPSLLLKRKYGCCFQMRIARHYKLLKLNLHPLEEPTEIGAPQLEMDMHGLLATFENDLSKNSNDIDPNLYVLYRVVLLFVYQLGTNLVSELTCR